MQLLDAAHGSQCHSACAAACWVLQKVNTPLLSAYPCRADGDYSCTGGAINAVQSWLGVLGSSFAGNQAPAGAALALHSPAGVSWISSSSFVGNSGLRALPDASSSDSYMGAVLVQGPEDATAPDSSDAVRAACSQAAHGVVLMDSSFAGNSAAATLTSSGGALHVSRSWAAVVSTSFRTAPDSQWAAAAGGCMSADTSAVLLSNATFAGCSALKTGGALSLSSSAAVLLHVNMTHASSNQSGGCVYAAGSSIVSVAVHASRCRAEAGAALYLEQGSELWMGSSSMQQCTSRSSAGAVYLFQVPTCVMQDSLITGNEVRGRRGSTLAGLFCSLPVLTWHLCLRLHAMLLHLLAGNRGGWPRRARVQPATDRLQRILQPCIPAWRRAGVVSNLRRAQQHHV